MCKFPRIKSAGLTLRGPSRLLEVSHLAHILLRSTAKCYCYLYTVYINYTCIDRVGLNCITGMLLACKVSEDWLAVLPAYHSRASRVLAKSMGKPSQRRSPDCRKTGLFFKYLTVGCYSRHAYQTLGFLIIVA